MAALILIILLAIVTVSVSQAKSTPAWEPQEMFRYPPLFLLDLDFTEWAPCPGNKVEGACKCLDSKAMCTLTMDIVRTHSFPPWRTMPLLLSAENISTLYFYNNLPAKEVTISLDDMFNLDKITECFEAMHDITALFISCPHRACLISVGMFNPWLSAVEILYLDLPANYEENELFLRGLLENPNLRELYLSRTRLDTSDYDWWSRMFADPVRANLTIISFNSSDLNRSQMKELTRFFTHLSVLHFRRTHAPEIDDYLGNLQHLAITDDKPTSSFPKTCDSNSRSYFSSLVYLILDGNNIRYIPSSGICLPNLKFLSLNRNPISVVIKEQFSAPTFANLTWLSLKKRVGYIRLEAMAFANTNLQSIDLSDGQILFASNRVSEDTFSGCPSLTRVNLENNVFKGISHQKLKKLFMSFQRVRVLNLESSRVGSVEKDPFQTLRSIEHLLLSDNDITFIRDEAFSGLENLTVLRLDNNYITRLREEAFGSDTLYRLTTLNLSGNPFECTCSLVWLHQRLWSSPALFDVGNPYTHYACDNIPGTLVTDVFVNIQQCMLSHEAYVFTVVCSAILIFTLTSAMLLYRFRWHIRLVLHEAYRGSPQARWRQRRPEEFQFDLFVCYDSEDIRWVLDHLMPALEEGYGLRLCIHQRDFIPGKNITDNIEDCLATSKRVLAIFSPNFAESRWCQFELEMCLSHVVDNGDVITVVILQHVPARDLTGVMIALLRTVTYIEWGEEPDAQDSFWRRLTITLNDILPGGGH